MKKVKLYNPTVTSGIDVGYSGKKLVLPAGKVGECTEDEARFLLERYVWILLVVTDDIPYNFRSNNAVECREFKKYWEEWGNKFGLAVDNSSGHKYLIVGNIAYYIPNSITRAILGYPKAKFVPRSSNYLESLNKKVLPDIHEIRIIKNPKNKDDLYTIIEFPTKCKRKIPDEATLKKIGKTKQSAENISDEGFNSLKTGPNLVSEKSWDIEQNMKKTDRIQFMGPTHLEIGRDKIIQKGAFLSAKIDNRIQGIKKNGPVLKIIIAVIAGLIVAGIAYYLGWR